MHSYKFSKTQHAQKAQRNQEFSEKIGELSSPYYEWQVTVIFYTALHYLQAYFSDKTKYYPQTHEERDGLILKTTPLTPIYDNYRELKQLSLRCRYMCWSTNEHDVTIAKKNLATIRSHIEKLLM